MPRQPKQFTLRALMVVTAACCVLFAFLRKEPLLLIGLILVTSVGCAIVSAVSSPLTRMKEDTLVMIGVVTLCIVVVAAWILILSTR